MNKWIKLTGLYLVYLLLAYCLWLVTVSATEAPVTDGQSWTMALFSTWTLICMVITELMFRPNRINTKGLNK